MTSLFGDAFQLIDDTARPTGARAVPQDYSTWVRQTLTNLRPGDTGILRFRRPRPTAAFSPQDTAHPRYLQIREQARASGFEPIERGTGGRLTMFDENALGITLIAPHPDPRAGMMQRYEVFAGAIAQGLKQLGLDARIGELPNEYCPGKFSINVGGQFKLVGVAQRMNSHAVQMGAVVAVSRSDRACAAIAEAYQAMGLTFDPSTYGAVSDAAPMLASQEVCKALVETVSAAILP